MLYRHLSLFGSPPAAKIHRATAAHDKILGVEVLVPHVEKTFLPLEKTYVVLPAYNEAQTLSVLIPKIASCLRPAQRPFEIIVVNDGSSDETTPLLRSLAPDHATRELHHDINQGYGAALRTAFLWIIENAQAADAVVTLDADNTQDPIYIPHLLSALEKGFDGVTASYAMKGGHCTGVPLLRRVMSGFLNALFHFAIPLRGVKTYTNGFRAYRVSIVQAVHRQYPHRLMDETGFPGGTEFFLKVAGRGGKLTEIPFDLHYEHRGSGSKIRLFSTIRKYLKLVASGRRYASL